MTDAVRHCYTLAGDLARLAERDDTRSVEISIVNLDGSEAVQVRWCREAWPCPRCVVATLHPRFRSLSCYEGVSKVSFSPLNRHGVDTLRSALAWMCGDIKHPEAR